MNPWKKTFLYTLGILASGGAVSIFPLLGVVTFIGTILLIENEEKREEDNKRSRIADSENAALLLGLAEHKFADVATDVAEQCIPENFPKGLLWSDLKGGSSRFCGRAPAYWQEVERQKKWSAWERDNALRVSYLGLPPLPMQPELCDPKTDLPTRAGTPGVNQAI